MAARSRDKGRRVRILVIGGLAVALAIAGFFAYRTWWGSSDTPVTYVTEEAAKTTLISSVSGTGNVSAGSTSSVVPTVSGEVTDLSVQVGDTVTTGQVLFVLVNAQLDLDVQSAEANYQQAQQRLNTAELAVLQAEQSLDDLEDQQASQSASLPTSSAVVLVSYSRASSNTGARLASTGWPPTTSTTSTSDSTTTTSTTSTTLPPTTLPPTTLPPTTLPPTTGPPITTPPTTSTPPTSQPGGGGGGATTPTTSKTVTDLDIAVAEQKVASAEVDVTIAQSTLDSSAYTLTQAKANAAARTVVAPTDGTVTAVNVSDGDDYGSTGASSSASSGSGGGATSGTGTDTGAAASSSGSAAVVITDLNSFEVTTALGETDVVAVAKGDKATLTFDALPDLTLVGKVDRVATVGAVSSGVVSYDVTVVPDTGNEQVRAGMTSTATIITESKVDALAVPSASVKTDQSGNTYVLVLKNGAPVQQTVQTGMTTDTYIEITGGLTEGQAVVTRTVGGATTATTARAGSGGILGGGGGGPPGGFPGGGGGFPGGGN